MTLDSKKLADLVESDIQALIPNRDEEGRELDYKEQLKIGSDSDRKEFLAPSAFAVLAGCLPEWQRGLPSWSTLLPFQQEHLMPFCTKWQGNTGNPSRANWRAAFRKLPMIWETSIAET